MTDLQWAILTVVDGQPYECKEDGITFYSEYRFTQDERKAALLLVKKGWLILADKSGNYFELTSSGSEMLTEANVSRGKKVLKREKVLLNCCCNRKQIH